MFKTICMRAILAAFTLSLVSSSALAGPVPGLNGDLENAATGLEWALDDLRESRTISREDFDIKKATVRAYLNAVITAVDEQAFAPAELQEVFSLGTPEDKRFEIRNGGNTRVDYRPGEAMKDAYFYGFWIRAAKGQPGHPNRDVRGKALNVNNIRVYFRGEVNPINFDAYTGQYPVMGEFVWIPFEGGVPRQIDKIRVNAKPSAALGRSARLYMKFAIEK